MAKEKGRAMNIRRIDDKLYSDFKSVIFAKGFKNIRAAVIGIMKAMVSAHEKPKQNQ